MTRSLRLPRQLTSRRRQKARLARPATSTDVARRAKSPSRVAASISGRSRSGTAPAHGDSAPQCELTGDPGSTTHDAVKRTAVLRRPAVQSAAAWRTWSGQTRVASYRLPDELLAELTGMSDELQLPIGLVVT